MYDFETHELVYWSHTCGKSPHDVEYIPLRGGFLAVANSRGNDSEIELYDLRESNNNKCIRPRRDHNGVHTVHWDGKLSRLWAWGAENVGLVSYKVVFESDSMRLVRDQEFHPHIAGFTVGVGHGSSPMITPDKRYLLLAGKSGILRFDTESHDWNVVKWAPNNEGPYSNPKGLAYNIQTGEVILTQSNSKVYSVDAGVREMPESDIYKAPWWQHNGFSNYEETTSANVTSDSAANIAAHSRSNPSPVPSSKTDIAILHTDLSTDFLAADEPFIAPVESGTPITHGPSLSPSNNVIPTYVPSSSPSFDVSVSPSTQNYAHVPSP